jgi:hypothetical protein
VHQGLTDSRIADHTPAGESSWPLRLTHAQRPRSTPCVTHCASRTVFPAAGVTAAESARIAGFDGRITLVGAEAHPPYTRPALSKALLRGHQSAETVRLPPTDAEAETRPGVTATALDAQRRRVGLSDGDWLEYSELVIATGARARTLGDLTGTSNNCPFALVNAPVPSLRERARPTARQEGRKG